MKSVLYLIICILLILQLSACQDRSSRVALDGNSIYYWRTTFSLSEKDNAFLKAHDISKLYLRLFDVDVEENPKLEEIVSPKATLKFEDSIPAGIEIVPVIFITNSAMDRMQIREEEYAEKIFKRVSAMCKANKIDFKEMQLDCDWTKRTQGYFYRLCESIKNLMDSTQTLSSTIRLHQLTQSPPPVDKGVLMVYNTGNIMEINSENSIFSAGDIKPYLKDDRLAQYPLPLDIAYPAYGWSLVFYPIADEYHFDRIMKRTDFAEYQNLEKVGPNVYEALDDIDFSDAENEYDKIYRGYRIKVERPSVNEILEIKDIIDRQLQDKNHSTILYHLDETQLSNFSNNEISKIYSHN